MAKTKGKNKKSEFSIRRVNTKEDRKRPSVFMRLKTEEAFKGIALFEPDPEAEDNPGYFEYYDHYDKQANQYVPCAGDKCPFCAANDNPSTRALTVWYFPDAGDVKEQIKVFTMNYSTIGDISDEAEEEDGLMGKKVRIKRLNDKGNYKVRVLSDKPLSKSDLKKIMKALEEKFPDGLEAVVTSQLKRQLERLKALDALDDEDDDDDDDDDEPKSSRKGKEQDDDEDDDEEEEEESDDDEEEESDDDDEEKSDDDEEEEEESDDDEEEETEDEAESEEISGEKFEVVKIQEKDEIFDLKNDDGKFKMWLGEGVDVDYDVVKKGTEVTVDAQQDAEGDWIITAMKYKKPKSTSKSSSKKKDGKKGSKKK